MCGVGELHAAFLNESRTRGRVRYCVAGNPGALRSKNIPGKFRGTADPSASLQDDKGEGGVSMESSCCKEGVFIILGGPRTTTPPVEMTILLPAGGAYDEHRYD
jgi:hypothetical protein